MAYIPYNPQPPSFQGYGTAEANYGSAPYAEAAQKAQYRLSLQDRLLAALSGLSAVPRRANFGTAFLAAAGGSARATWAAKQAAMNYAQRQADQEIHRQTAEAFKAQTAKPPKPEKDRLAEAEQILGRPLTETERQRLAGVYVPPPKPITPKAVKPPAAPKPPHPRAAVMKRLDLINMADPTNPEHVKRLQQIIRNPATPEEGAAAAAKIKKAYGPLFNIK